MIKISNLARNYLKYLVAAIIIFVPLYPKFPLILFKGVSVSIRLEDVLIFVALNVFIIAILPKITDLKNKRIHRSIFLFIFIGLVSVLSGIFITKTVVLHVGMLHWLRRVEYLSVFFVGAYSVQTKENILFYVRCFILVIVIAFTVGLGQKYFEWPVITTQNSEYSKGLALTYLPGGHLVSTFAGHYDMANYMILMLPLLYALLLGRKETVKALFRYKSDILNRILIIIPLLMAFWLMIQAASRISIASYIVGVTLILIFVKRIRLIPVVLVISVLLTGFSSNLISRYFNIVDVTYKKVFQNMEKSLIDSFYVYALEDSKAVEKKPEVQEDRSTSIRLNVEWPRAIRALKKNIFLGTGYSSITLATDNDYLRLLGEVGILGFVSFAIIFVELIISELKYFYNKKVKTLRSLFVGSVIASTAAILISMVFIDIMEASKLAITFWLMHGIAFGYLNYHGKKNQ